MDAHLSPSKLTPLVLTGVLIALDRASKLLVTAQIPRSSYPSPVRLPVLDSLFSLVRIDDPAFAFGVANRLPDGVQTTLFLVVPAVTLAAIFCFLAIGTPRWSKGVIWSLAALMGGALSNSLDRIIYHGYVVNIFEFRLPPIFPHARYIATNFADLTVAVAAVAMVVSLALSKSFE
jgi:lipoprotein signal peptidase